MNLIIKTTLFYLLLSVLVFGAGGVLTYQIVRSEVTKETDFALYEHMREIEEEILEGLPLELLMRERVGIQKLPAAPPPDTFFVFSDTLALHPYLDEKMEPYRKLDAVRKVGDGYYRFSITDIFIESDDIYDVVVKIMWQLFLILGLSMLVSSFLVTRWLLRPFRRILRSIQQFSLRDESPLDLPQRTSTREFRQLNAFIQAMTLRARQDFKSVKEFSENASHEMQTPLSIARGKLDLLQESEDLGQEQLELISGAQQALRRLSKLNNALLLLTKIENEEFRESAPLDFSKVVRISLDNFRDLAGFKGLSLKQETAEAVYLRLDLSLAEILVSNVISNAIRHNIKGGEIEVVLNQAGLRVRNTGQPLSVPAEQLFQRFQKSRQSERSLGLGLSIVRKICQTNDLTVDYNYQEGWHEVWIGFPKNV